MRDVIIETLRIVGLGMAFGLGFAITAPAPVIIWSLLLP